LVLIVEDHPDTQSALAEVFEQAGYETAVASDGDAGLSIVRARHPALVCLDLHLPRISGHDVCERIREDPSLDDVAIMMTSAGRSPEDHGHALDAGADMYMAKPLLLDELIAVAAELIAARSSSPCVSADRRVLAKDDVASDALADVKLARVAG
jgi:DNA-binding response OmpR family regulator